MAKVKKIGNNLDSNLNGDNFTNITSNTIFSVGSFTITSNFDGKETKDFSNELSTFTKPITLETMGISETQSNFIEEKEKNVSINLDKSDLKTFVRFGSAYEFIRTSIENIVVNYPGSLFIDPDLTIGQTTTILDYNYDAVNNITSFRIPITNINNDFQLIYERGSKIDENTIKNLNDSFNEYLIWDSSRPNNNTYSILGFTGYTSGNKFISIKVKNNPFPTITGNTDRISFHIKPKVRIFEEYRASLNKYEQYLISNRDNTDGFQFKLKEPTLLDNGNVVYNKTSILWDTSDGYNIDINTTSYSRFLERILTIATKYDNIKTDLIARFLTPESIKLYDLTNDGKITKLLRLYGREFDQIREFIDSLVYVNTVKYDKTNNIPDKLVKNLARTFGWDYFDLLNEDELVESVFSIDENERNLSTDLMPSEINIELWRRILLNTSYYWKGKGTRDVIKSIFLLIGIPEPFINITEYIYTVDGKIDPNEVNISLQSLPSSTYPFYSDGYPKAPIETNDFYFQTSGDSDGGEAYMDVFRMVGFELKPVIDNRKTWVDYENVLRKHNTTPEYFHENRNLILNTKAIDVALDIARGIEYDVFTYVTDIDYPINSSGYTLPFSYMNISVGFDGVQNVFDLPVEYTTENIKGDLEVRFNGILLNGQKMYSGGSETYQELISDPNNRIDYIVSGNSFTLLNTSATNSNNKRDVIQATFVYSGDTNTPIHEINTQYILFRFKPNGSTGIIELPSKPRGDIQLTINGIALTKGTNQFTADYIVDSENNRIIIQNQEVISYLSTNPEIQVAYIEIEGTDDVLMKNEILRVDSFNGGKFYYSHNANKNVFKLNFKINNTSDVKVLINGIMLEPNRDYYLNPDNNFEIYLPKSIKYGTIISVYYLIGGSEFRELIIDDVFNLGDISEFSFLEFIDKISKKLINVRNRKTITNFSGGWYPTLLKIYQTYLKRSYLDKNEPLNSNGYTFENLYPFLNKYNTFFDRFINQLIPSTVIRKRNGLLVRNSIFTKQKFPYKRGVTLIKEEIVNTNVGGIGEELMGLDELSYNQYLGDDGSLFKIMQDDNPSPIDLSVSTKTASFDTTSFNSGGESINGFEIVTEYGMEYQEVGFYSQNNDWIQYPSSLLTTPLTNNNYNITITGLTENTEYRYRSIVKSNSLVAKGEIKQGKTNESSVIHDPSVTTTLTNSVTINEIKNTGGNEITRIDIITGYGMQYRKSGESSWITHSGFINNSLSTDSYDYNITGLDSNTEYEYRAMIKVDSTPYYGETRMITTDIDESIPTITTGSLKNKTINSFDVYQSSVDDDGNNLIVEYGVIYTKSSSVDLEFDSFDTLPSNVYKKFSTSSINVGDVFTNTIDNLDSNTTYYYRAYAKNGLGYGYGSKRSTKTLAIMGELEMNVTGRDEQGTYSQNTLLVDGKLDIYNNDNNTKIGSIPISQTGQLTTYNSNLSVGDYYIVPSLTLRIDGGDILNASTSWKYSSNSTWESLNGGKTGIITITENNTSGIDIEIKRLDDNGPIT